MWKVKWLGTWFVLSLISPVLSGDSSVSELLTSGDYMLEIDQEVPALSSGFSDKEQWESYNEWRCFPTREVELTCVEIEYGDRRKSPVIIATNSGHRLEYDLDPTFRWDCDFTLKEWRETIGTSSEVCLFGAFLQSLDEKASLFVLSQFKSEIRYWREYESASYKYARRDVEEAKSTGSTVFDFDPATY